MITQQSYIVVASSPANVGVCMGEGQLEEFD